MLQRLILPLVNLFEVYKKMNILKRVNLYFELQSTTTEVLPS